MTDVSRKSDRQCMQRIVREISDSRQKGHNVIIVSSGAVACGREKLQEYLTDDLSMRKYASVGQAIMMSRFSECFAKVGTTVSQVLLNEEDFDNDHRIESIIQMIRLLLKDGIVPILNENDAITVRETHYVDDGGKILWDNDSLASLLAINIKADNLILASNIDGVYHQNCQIISEWDDNHFDQLQAVETSTYGRGGITAKIRAAIDASHHGTTVYIINGKREGVIRRTLLGGRATDSSTDSTNGTDTQNGSVAWTGTRFSPKTNCSTSDENPTIRDHQHFTDNNRFKEAKKMAATVIRFTSLKERDEILQRFRDLIIERKSSILEANSEDLEIARESNLQDVLVKRLILDDGKIDSLVKGIDRLIELGEVVDKILEKKYIPHPFVTSYNHTHNLNENKRDNMIEWIRRQVPLGLILVIFESRPDVLVQLLSLAIKTGNGMVLKGGSEAKKSLQALYDIFLEAVPDRLHSGYRLLLDRSDAMSALTSPDFDLIIPRGSGSFIETVKQAAVAPVIGHGSGICCGYLHSDIEITNVVLDLIVHSKTDYPAACNSLELLLINRDILFQLPIIISYLSEHGVVVLGGKSMKFLDFDLPIEEHLEEHGDYRLTIDVVDSIDDAIGTINEIGSGHTDMIITNDKHLKSHFFKGVRSSSVFSNCSTRCADGFRMGMGCEVGINTTRSIWFRGPVGVEALMTTQITESQ